MTKPNRIRGVNLSSFAHRGVAYRLSECIDDLVIIRHCHSCEVRGIEGVDIQPLYILTGGSFTCVPSACVTRTRLLVVLAHHPSPPLIAAGERTCGGSGRGKSRAGKAHVVVVGGGGIVGGVVVDEGQSRGD